MLLSICFFIYIMCKPLFLPSAWLYTPVLEWPYSLSFFFLNVIELFVLGTETLDKLSLESCECFVQCLFKAL